MDKLIGSTQPNQINPNLALIVEGDPALQIVYSYSVVRDGYEALVAGDGRVALEVLQTQTPRLIFLDMRLPRGSGVKVLKYISNDPRFNDTHVVLMSANEKCHNQQHTVRSCEFRLKPLLPSHIQAITDQLA